MEDKLKEFRKWLYQERKNTVGAETDELEIIISKFEELGLDKIQ